MQGPNPRTPIDFRNIPDGQEFVIRNTIARMKRTFLPIGSTIGKYRIIEEIDRGGMAVVYKAMQLDLERVVALKVIPATISINPRLLDRFLAEAHAVSKLSHPSIVSIHEISTESNVYFIAMDYIPGLNLADYLHRYKPKLIDVLDIVVRLAEALGYAHRHRIIHRDLKLNNVIMRDDTTPVLIDFGLAKALEEDGSHITRTGELVGSPAYMAPERILGGAADSRSDICSLGIMLYEMLTFKNPYLDQRSIHQTSMNVIEADPIPPRKLVPWLPSEVEAITLKAMHADPARRYQTMEDMRDDIARYQHGEYVLAQPPSLTYRIRHFLRKFWPYVAMGALVMVFGSVLGMTYYIQSEKGKAHWQLLHQERFGSRELGGLWSPGHDNTRLPPSDASASPWVVENGALVYRGGRKSWVRFERPLTRDIRLECDIAATGANLRDLGVFLYGDSPEKGYCFHLYRDAEAVHGMTAPGSPLLVNEYNPLQSPLSRTHHVEIERRQRMLSFRIDGIQVARLWDYFPPLGRGHQHMGFFAEDQPVAFDNLRIYQLAIPMAPSPTLVADRLWERGDFSAALDEYLGLTIDFSRNEIVRTIELRVPECLIRLGRPSEALDRLTRGPLFRFGSDAAEAEALFLVGVAHKRMGEPATADSLWADVCERYGGTTAARSAALSLAEDKARAVQQGPLTEEELLGLEELVQRIPRHWTPYAPLHLVALERLLESGQIDRARALSSRLVELYEYDSDLSALMLVAAARVELGKRNPKKAVEILNRCVAAHKYSQAVWEAWMLLGSVYEYDRNYRDAVTIYRKVYRECPHGYHSAWMARVRMAELAKRAAYEESVESICRDVIDSPHPFALPRAIAQLYMKEIGETRFTDLWHSYHPDDWYFLYHLARKAVLEGENVVAEIYLQQLLHYLQPSTWRYLRVHRLMNELG